MGLAPYGEPKYVDDIKRALVNLRDDGSIGLNQEYFTYCQGLRMTGRGFERLFGGPAPATRVEDHAAGDGPGTIRPGSY